MLYFWSFVFPPFTFLFSGKWFQCMFNLTIYCAAVIMIPLLFPLAFLMWLLCVLWAWSVANEIGHQRAKEA